MSNCWLSDCKKKQKSAVVLLKIRSLKPEERLENSRACLNSMAARSIIVVLWNSCDNAVGCSSFALTNATLVSRGSASFLYPSQIQTYRRRKASDFTCPKTRQISAARRHAFLIYGQASFKFSRKLPLCAWRWVGRCRFRFQTLVQ